MSKTFDTNVVDQSEIERGYDSEKPDQTDRITLLGWRPRL